MSGVDREREDSKSPRTTDPCSKRHKATINSPKEAVLSTVQKDDILDVEVDASGIRPILLVKKDLAEAGSLTFPGYLDVIECIRKHGIIYKAHVIRISGAIYDVQVVPQ